MGPGHGCRVVTVVVLTPCGSSIVLSKAPFPKDHFSNLIEGFICVANLPVLRPALALRKIFSERGLQIEMFGRTSKRKISATTHTRGHGGPNFPTTPSFMFPAG